MVFLWFSTSFCEWTAVSARDNRPPRWRSWWHRRKPPTMARSWSHRRIGVQRWKLGFQQCQSWGFHWQLGEFWKFGCKNQWWTWKMMMFTRNEWRCKKLEMAMRPSWRNQLSFRRIHHLGTQWHKRLLWRFHACQDPIFVWFNWEALPADVSKRSLWKSKSITKFMCYLQVGTPSACMDCNISFCSVWIDSQKHLGLGPIVVTQQLP